MTKQEILKSWLDASSNIVFFGGAGVSTESGIPDFRSTDGLYSQQYKYPPEQILSHDFFVNNTAEFYNFYKQKMINLTAQPNYAHRYLAKLEQKNKLKAVVTQNIDGLHQMAGSKNVFELHGSVHRNYCENCGKLFSVDRIVNSDRIPHCECGGVIKPDVVLYEESLDEQTILGAVSAIKKCEMLIVGGTSLTVYPASSLINYYKGSKLVLINKSITPYDQQADLCINESIGRLFEEIDDI
ncbi:MAG: NAD-dependent protein deacylase [Clostridia bacterium]